MKESLKSCYKSSVLDIEEKYPIGPLSGYLTEKYDEHQTFNALDMVKAYPSCLQEIDTVPVFGYFDEYVPYDNHKIEQLTMYCVESHAKNISEAIIFPTTFYRCYGIRLLKAKSVQINFTVHYFRRACNIEPVNFRSPLEELFAKEKLDIVHKKFIANKTIGLTEKKHNTAHLCKLFDNYAEAQFYQLKYGGRVHTLQQSMKTTPEYDPLNDGLEPLDESCNTSYTYGPKLHILIVEKKERLVDGYRPIKEIIYDKMAIKMFDLYKDVVTKGLIPKGIKTDAILVSESRFKLEKLFTFDSSKIGGLKFEKEKYCTNRKICQLANEPFIINVSTVKDIPIVDEYDTAEFKKVFDTHNRLNIKGLFPGVGKSTSVINYKGHNLLFVTPFNKLAQETRSKGHQAITLNMLLGFYGDGQEYRQFSSYNVKDYDCICFDEIMMNPPNVLKRIDEFMNTHPEIKFFATGDTDQLQPINFAANNVTNPQDYAINCITQLFPNQITLKINKRPKTQEQRDKLHQLKADVFDKKKNTIDTLKRFGFKIITEMKNVKSTKNICYFNYRTNQVNKHVHKHLVTKPANTVKFNYVDYWQGLELTCKKHYQSKGVRLFKNYVYCITKIDNKKFTVTDRVEGTSFTGDLDMLDHFKLPYANTCHSVQGLSIEGPVTIFDANTPYADRFFLWTALTRATDFDNVTIFQHSEDEVSALNKSKVKQYFTQKVDGYKRQDKVAGRTWEKDEFVDPDFINDEYGKLQVKCCLCCKSPYELVVGEDGQVTSNITIDRIDSNIAHIKSNSRLLCKNCNCTKGNRY